ncbi:MAG: class III extradiol ring-cleavage dioxygenase [Acidobacteriota bacterium]
MTHPAFFVSHGAPTLALETDGDYARALRAFCAAMPAPRALVVFSGHFQEAEPIRITSGVRPPLLYDFGGFAEEMYRIRYDAPGDPALAARIWSLLAASGFDAALDPKRPWDHGAWVPLRLAFPEARVPVVEVSLPAGASPETLLRIGAALAPLRDEDVLLIGSGGIVHNLRRVRLGNPGAGVEPWAEEFDRWVAQRLEKMEIPALQEYARLAPHAALAVPTSEHFDPLFVVLGARRPSDRIVPVYEGFQYGTLSLRSFGLQGS